MKATLIIVGFLFALIGTFLKTNAPPGSAHGIGIFLIGLGGFFVLIAFQKKKEK